MSENMQVKPHGGDRTHREWQSFSEGGSLMFEMQPDYRQIEVTKIHLADDRLRQLDYRLAQEMWESVAQVGLLQPIAVRIVRNQSYEFELMYGARRLHAWQQHYRAAVEQFDKAAQSGDDRSAELAEMQRWELIPTLVYNEQTTDQEVSICRHVENLHRVNLTPKQRVNLQRGYDNVSNRPPGKFLALAAPLNPTTPEDSDLAISRLVRDLHNLHDEIGMPATKSAINAWWHARRLFHNTGESVLGPSLERLAGQFTEKLPMKAIGIWWSTHYPNGRPAWHNDGSISFTTGIRKSITLVKKIVPDEPATDEPTQSELKLLDPPIDEGQHTG
jgi:hypothetical protein